MKSWMDSARKPGRDYVGGAELAEHVRSLRRYAIALTGDPSEADDLVQESLVRALARIEEGAEVRNARTYLFSILHNLRVDLLARRARRGVPMPLEAVEHRLSRPAEQPARLRHAELALAIDALPEQQRAVLLLVALEGASYQEVAEILNIAPGTVMSRLSRARKALRTLMEESAVTNLRRMT